MTTREIAEIPVTYRGNWLVWRIGMKLRRQRWQARRSTWNLFLWLVYHGVDIGANTLLRGDPRVSVSLSTFRLRRESHMHRLVNWIANTLFHKGGPGVLPYGPGTEDDRTLPKHKPLFALATFVVLILVFSTAYGYRQVGDGTTTPWSCVGPAPDFTELSRHQQAYTAAQACGERADATGETHRVVRTGAIRIEATAAVDCPDECPAPEPTPEPEPPTGSEVLADGRVMLRWREPTENTDGSPLVDLASYTVYLSTGQTVTVPAASPAPAADSIAALPSPFYGSYTLRCPDGYTISATTLAGVESERSAPICLNSIP